MCIRDRCYFITEGTPAAKAAEGVKEYSISGKAGKQTVTIGISDEGQDYDNAVSYTHLSGWPRRLPRCRKDARRPFSAGH